MSNFKKIAVIASAVVLVGVSILYLNLGSIVKTVAEDIGSQTLGTKVSIGSIDIKAMEKSITVRNISIANPKGYSKPYAMKLELINIAAENLSSELLVFNDVTIKGAELFLEVTDKGTNLSALKSNVDKNKKAPSKTVKSEGGVPPKVIIKKFLLSGTQLHSTSTLLGGDLKDISLPDIKLKGIGQSKGGASAKEVVAKIWGSLSTAAVQASAKEGFLKGISAESLKEISSSIKLPKNTLDQAKGSIGKAKEGFKALFGK